MMVMHAFSDGTKKGKDLARFVVHAIFRQAKNWNEERAQCKREEESKRNKKHANYLWLLLLLRTLECVW